MTTAQRRSQDAYDRRRSRYEEAARLRAAGVSISAIAVALGAQRKTIRRWLRAGGAPLWSKPPRTSILTTYHAHLERRWAEGCHNASLFWREVAELGFTGRPGVGDLAFHGWGDLNALPPPTRGGVSFFRHEKLRSAAAEMCPNAIGQLTHIPLSMVRRQDGSKKGEARIR